MRLLYLALDCPLPANNGLRLRTWCMLRALRQEGCQITLVCQQAAGAAPSRSALHEVCESVWMLDHRVSSLTQGGDWGARLGSLASALPHAALRFRSAAVRDLVARLGQAKTADAIVCDTVFAAVNVPDELRPLIINHHNIEHRIFESYRAVETNPCKRAAAGWECRKVRDWELQVGRRAALQWVCSGTDRAALLRQQPHARVVVAPNIADRLESAPGGETDPNLVLFQGALDWFPNRDAVEFFLESAWPLVLRRCPEARLRIVGRNPPPAFLARHRHRAGVEFTGTVADVYPHLAQAAVSIAPLRIGSGTRLKILEAAALAKPVVATPLGAEGLELVPDDEILLAEQPAEFAAAVACLLGSPELRHRIGSAARARVCAQYSFAALRQSVRLGLEALVVPSRTPAGVCMRDVAALES